MIDRRTLAPTRAEIDLSALRHNVRTLQQMAGAARLMAVVKANAYGHGAVRVVDELRRMGVDRYAVATLAEAVELREAGVEEPILVFASPVPDDLPTYAAYDLGVTVTSDAVSDAVLRTAKHSGPLEAHLKVDTGMGRIGVPPASAEDTARRLMAGPGVRLASLWTHLATADEPSSTFVEEQLDRFLQAVRSVRDDVPFIHVANSGALLNHLQSLDLDARTFVRPGITLYGLSPSPEDDQAASAGLRPVMRLVSRVTQVKRVAAGTSISYSRRWIADSDHVIATVAAGYADGYPRVLTNRGAIGIGGRLHPVAGTVCMDMTMVDLGAAGDSAAVSAGDDAVLFGEGGPSCFDVARASGTITYEIACRVSRRVPRLYLESSDPA